jgi:RNA polymerase sigma-70 factor, ECF subfamily
MLTATAPQIKVTEIHSISQLIPDSLVSEVANGNEQSLAKLYDLTKHIVYNLAHKILWDQAVAEEVTLEVYLQIWKQAHNYHQGKGTFLAWLVTITRSRSIDRLRQENRLKHRYKPFENTVKLASKNENPEAASIVTEYSKRVQVALTKLPQSQREALTMAYYFGMTQTEIAEKLGLPLGTIKSRIRYGLMHVKHDLIETNSK